MKNTWFLTRWLDVVWNVTKIVSLGLGAWLAERAGVEVVYFSGGLLFTFGLIGLMALHKK